MPDSRIPGPLGVGANRIDIDEGTLIRTASAAPGPVGGTVAPASDKLDADLRALAALAYGESSTKDVFEEMAAIANVVVRQQKARGFATVAQFLKTDKTFAFAASDGNDRHKLLKNSSDKVVMASPGMSMAVRAARNALDPNGKDYSNGGYFWDGADIATNYDAHVKVKDGIKFTDPKHNIYNIKETVVPGEEWWLDAKRKPTRLRGKWNYKYESTAAYGGTIFWKYNADFLQATGNKVHK